MKRATDVLLGTLLAALATPLIVVLALALLVQLRTWPLFLQLRVGRDEDLFRMPKLRTLPRTVGPYACKHSFGDLELPVLCRFLRRSHLDELPQLYLVPLGRMSLVGPRPKMPDWAEPIDRRHSVSRTTIRPGCTGLWQIGKHAYLRVSDSPGYDYFYLQNTCLRLDLWILWRTILLLAGIGRSVSLAQVPFWTRGAGVPVLATVDAPRRSVRRHRLVTNRFVPVRPSGLGRQ